MSVNTEKQRQTLKEHIRHKKARRTLTLLRVVIGILLVVVIALAAVLYLAKAGLIFQSAEPAPLIEELFPTETPLEPTVYTLSCVTPLEEPLSVEAQEGESVTVPEAPAIEGYTFLRWVDGKGEPLEESELVLNSDLTITAVYAPAFRNGAAETSHTAYLCVDGDGFFHPDEALSRREAAVLLASSLEVPLEGSGSFLDLAQDDACYEAAGGLKAMGAVSGTGFYPDDPMRCGDLFAILSAFFPKPASEYSFDNIARGDAYYEAFCLAMEKGWIDDTALSPDQILTRRDAARIFNRILGRAGVVGDDYAQVGTILDVSFRDPDFWEIAEAVIPHEASFTDDGECWTASEALPLREEGMFFIGTRLHCIDDQGSAVVNESYGNFDFGADGVITTGMPELDALVQEKLEELVDPSTMEREEMLRILYSDVTYHNSYLSARNDQLHEIGDISWVNDAAYRMFTVKKGCCYNFAAEFYVLAKAIGYDAVIYSGTINPPPKVRSHGWVEIEFDGVPYIFDTELEYTQVITGHTGTVYYKISYERVKGWYYNRGEE